MSNQNRETIQLFRTDAWALYLKGFEVFSKESSTSNRLSILKPELKLPYEYFDDNKKYGLYLTEEETAELKKADKNQSIILIIGFFLFFFGLLFMGLAQIFESNHFFSNSGIFLVAFAMLTLPSLLFNELNKERLRKNVKIKYGIKNSP